MLAGELDDEMREMAKEELELYQQQLEPTGGGDPDSSDTQGS